jgi:hypothetical protein
LPSEKACPHNGEQIPLLTHCSKSIQTYVFRAGEIEMLTN